MTQTSMVDKVVIDENFCARIITNASIVCGYAMESTIAVINRTKSIARRCVWSAVHSTKALFKCVISVDGAPYAAAISVTSKQVLVVKSWDFGEHQSCIHFDIE